VFVRRGDMSKLASLVVAAMLLLPTGNFDREKFAKYKAVEAYEIRPGILMMPRYSTDGQVCEIGLQRLHYSPEKIWLDSSLARKEIEQIFDELVPGSERGPRPPGVLEQGMTTFSGRAIVSDEEYQNVSIHIYGQVSPDGKATATMDEVTATLKWKDRNCR
jgi:hypothetical protein